MKTKLLILMMGLSATGWSQSSSIFTNGGSNTWEKPTGVTKVTVEAWGGGGKGGDADGFTCFNYNDWGCIEWSIYSSFGGGGAGGAYNRGTMECPLSSYPVFVGRGGGTYGGSSGENSSFGSDLVVANGGAAGQNGDYYTTYGAGAQGASGIFNGGNGGSGGEWWYWGDFYDAGGGGGGGAGNTGSGGGGYQGNGGGGGSGSSTATQGGYGGSGNYYEGNGYSAIALSGGGGGAENFSDYQNDYFFGGNGYRGQVIIYYYQIQSLAALTPVCPENVSAITINSTSILAGKTYTVTYNLSPPNEASALTASMPVTSAGSGSFTIPASSLSNTGTTSVTITEITDGTYTGGIGVNNAVNIIVYDGIWLGTTSTDWNNASNWCGGIPTAATDVTIPSGPSNQPVIGASGGMCRNITIESGTSLSMTGGSSLLSVYGNWTINSGTFNPGSSTVTFTGPDDQVINSTSADLIFDHLAVDKSAGVLTLSKSASVNELTLASLISTGSNTLSVLAEDHINRTSGHVNGNLEIIYSNTGFPNSETFHIGDATNYMPVTLYFDNITAGGGITASTLAGEHPDIASSEIASDNDANRYWTLINDGLGFTSCDATFTFVPGDLDATADPSVFSIGKYDAGAWTCPDVGILTATSAQATGMTSFSSFAIGELVNGCTADLSYQGVFAGEPASFTGTTMSPLDVTASWEINTGTGWGPLTVTNPPYSVNTANTGNTYTSTLIIDPTSQDMNGYQYRVTFENSIKSCTSNGAVLVFDKPTMNLLCGDNGSKITGTDTPLNLTGNVYVHSVGAGANGAVIDVPVGLGTATRTFSVQNSAAEADLTVSGAISGSPGVVKLENGNLKLGGSNIYSDATTIGAGMLQLGASNAVPSNPFILNGGVFNSGSPAGNNDVLGYLELTDNSVIELGAGNHVLSFAASNSGSWSPGKMLTINGWTGSYNGTSGTGGQLYAGSDATGLTESQLDQILFYNGTNYFRAVILATGEVVADADKIATGTITGSPFCAGASGITVPFTYELASNFIGATFIAQLSDASGSFASPTNLQGEESNGSGSQSISVIIPADAASGSGYRIRVVSDVPAVNGNDNGSDIVISRPGRKYITVNGSGAENGDDWANAMPGTQLQAAINDPCATEVWVAKGIYKPTVAVGGTGDRYKTFQMRNVVPIYGGFAGTETNISQRINYGPGGVNETILSGDLNNDDVYSSIPWQNIAENCYHVFYHPAGLNLNNTAILDGVTIKGGNADGPDPHYIAGGMYNSVSSPKLNKVAFLNNTAYSAGAFYVFNSSPVVENSIFRNNLAGGDGGAMFLQGTSYPVFTNCLITNNRAYNYGGGIFNASSETPLFINATIANNHASQRGGGVYHNGFVLVFRNSILWGNLADEPTYPGKQFYNNTSNAHLQYTCFSNGTGDMHGQFNLINTINSDPAFVDPALYDYRIKGISPCADAGNSSENTLTTDIRGAGFGRKLLKTNYLAEGPIDMGAYEYNSNTDPFGCNNLPPVAHAGGPYTCDLHSSLTLDGSGSSDPNAECGDQVTAWHWDLDDDEEYDDASGPAPLIPSDQIDIWGIGNRPVAIRVTDSFGATSTASTTLDIYDNRPFPVFSANPDPACSGQPVQFDAGGSHHGSPDRSIENYEWDFDYQPANFTADGSGVTINHSFPTGSYTVALMVTDDNTPPKSEITSRELIVNPVPDFDIIVHASQPVCGGALVEFSVSTPQGTFTYAWDFGDATPVGPTNGFRSKAIAPNTCPGTFTATCTVTDADGDCATQKSVTVTVDDDTMPEIVSPFSIKVNNDQGACGATIAYDGFMDPGTDPFDGIIGDDCNYAGNGPADYPETEVIIRKPVIFSDVPQPIPTLNVGEEAEIGPFVIESFFDIYTDPAPLPPPSGTWDPASATGNMKVKVKLTAESSDTRFYDTEMTQLDLAGGTLPTGMMFRESPTLASTGKLKIEELSPGGPYRIDSFFDIFTEVSTDGGSTWNPASVPLHVSRFTNRTTPTVAYHDNCSAPALVQTSGLESGSLFPVGITVNTFEVTDACGNTSTTSFEVIVTDAEPPVMTCPDDQNVSLNCISNNYTVLGTEFDLISLSDNCGTITSIMNDHNFSSTLLGAIFGPGTTTVTWTVLDDATPPNSSSCSFDVIVYQPTLTGTLKYNNAARTPLSGVELTISHAGTNVTSITDTGGNYSFTGLCAGNFTLQVTAINKPVGYINSTDASQINAWSVLPSPIERVKWMSGDVNYSGGINSTDAKAVQNFFVYFWPFARGEWTFWKAGQMVTSGDMNVEIPLAVTGNLIVDLLGQAVGDFNGSFTPGNLKGASATLDLTYGETRLAAAGTEVELPLRTVYAETVGAVSLILNYPEDLYEVTGVSLKFENGNLDWMAKGGELRAGWNTTLPQWFGEDEVLMIISGKISDSFGEGDEIRFTLASDPLNELADEKFNVIPDAKLGIDVLAFSTTGTNNNGTIEQLNTLTLLASPNPFQGYSIVDFRLPMDGHVNLEITDMLGRRVALLVDEYKVAGEYSMKLDASPLQPGVYMATLKLETSNGDLIKTLKLLRQQ